MPSVRTIGGIGDIAERFGAFIVDVWGVLHDGQRAYPGAIDCLSRLGAAGKRVVVVSNAARRIDGLAAELAEHGIGPRHYDDLVCSGELVWEKLHRPDRGGYGRRCYFLGPARSRGIVQDLDLEFVDGLEEADFILNTGTEHNPPTTDEFIDLLVRALDLQLPMFCANPDQVAIRHGTLGISAGAIARAYERMGGVVESLGKPHSAIYDAVRNLPGFDPEAPVLAVGDGMETDIRGGIGAGFGTVLITGGIHGDEIASLPGGLDSLCKKYGCRADFACPGFRWEPA